MIAETISHKIFIASPFFNRIQIQIVHRIETLCSKYGHEFYSARLHSGSAEMNPEEKRRFSAWRAVYLNDLQGLYWCDLCIAVLTYDLPPEKRLCVVEDTKHGQVLTEVRIPDAGTCWEIGFLSALGKPIIGYLPLLELEEANLMLLHSVDGVLQGEEELEKFLAAPDRYEFTPLHHSWEVI